MIKNYDQEIEKINHPENFESNYYLEKNCFCRKCGETLICQHDKDEFHIKNLCQNCI